MNIDIDVSIGNQKTMGGINATDERSMGDSDTTGGIGVTLGHVDQYELVRELGGGGFGVVYLARDAVSGIDVAVKGLPPVVKNNAEELDQIRRNFALVSRLHHPNIASALVLHPARDVHYEHEQVRQSLRVLSGDTLMVMTYAPGVTLSKWRKQFTESRVPVNLALDVCRQIASALDYAHAEKVVHRDIKPANIMVESRVQRTEFRGQGAEEPADLRTPTSELSVKVLDFGLAAEIRSSMNRVSQEKGDTSGTRPYMAPEQWAGKKQDGKTDQYALAVLFHELVSGEVPFSGAFETGDPIIMMVAVEQRTPDPLPMLSALQNSALMRALSKNPSQRYDSCSALWEALSGMQLSVEHSVKALGENGENIVEAVQTFNKVVAWISRLRIPHYLQLGREFLVELLASVPPVSRFVDRVLGVIIEPRQSWRSVQAEQITIWQICKRYVFALVAISMIPSVVDAFHSIRYSSGYWTFGYMMLAVVWDYLLTMAGLYLSARIISELAPKFGAPKVRENAFKLVVFSLTPVFLCTFLYFMARFPLPYWLVWCYAAFLLHGGIKVLMGVQKRKMLVFTAMSFVILIALYGGLGYCSTQAERNLSVWTQYGKRSWNNKSTASHYPKSQQVSQRSSKIPSQPVSPNSDSDQEDTYFEPSDIDSDSAIPPMNLPSDVWLHPKTLCTLIQRDFPSGSPTNTLIVFGLDSQAELNMFCEKMKENGWRIAKIGYGSKQQPGMMASSGISASFAKGQKTATLRQRKDYSFELVVYGPEDESVTPDKPRDPVPKPVNVEPPQQVSMPPVPTPVNVEPTQQVSAVPVPKPVNVEPQQQVSVPPVSNTDSDEAIQQKAAKSARILKMLQQREAEKAAAEKMEERKQQENALRLAEEKRNQEALDTEKKRIEADAKKVADDQKRLDEEKAKFEEAKRIVLTTRQASTSYLQRRLRLGYSRAARVVDQLEAAGVIGPQDGAKPREILLPNPTGDYAEATPVDSETETDNA
ncbi:MAG: protein kinase [bacterium]